MRNFREYDIWKLGMKIAKEVYLVTKHMPNEEKFGMISQIQRAAIPIPSNIAEGAARKTEKEFSQYLHISIGSSFELETQILLAIEIGYLKSSDVQQILSDLNTIQKQTNHLLNLLKKSQS
ncbi:MAG: four helix bundle protein [Bacteroidales bacterium]|jgi:four helix bundle protein|nr:four helix bundle protein [Bacteroidales bacterium]